MHQWREADGDWNFGPWSKYLRAKIDDAVLPLSKCWKGVWPYDPRPAAVRSRLLKDRDDCFFLEYHEGMSFETAEEMFRLKKDHRQLKRNYYLALAGLILTVFMLLATVSGC